MAKPSQEEADRAALIAAVERFIVAMERIANASQAIAKVVVDVRDRALKMRWLK